jgi:hypothetical protein
MRQQRGIAAALAVGAVMVLGWATSNRVSADPGQPPPPLPVFTPGPSDWSPRYDIWPYNTFTYQVTPEMVGGMSDACQWFGARYDPLAGQINDFNRSLGDHHDVYATVQSQANAVVASIDQATSFLLPRVKPLTIRNNPDNFGPYSPLYGGELITGVAVQLSRIADSIKRKEPSGVTHAYIVAAAGQANALRDSTACE